VAPHDQAAHPRLHRLGYVRLLVPVGQHGEHEARVAAAQLARQRHAAHVGQRPVDEHQVGVAERRVAQRHVAGRRFAANLQVGFAAEQQAQRLAHQGVIVDDEYPRPVVVRVGVERFDHVLHTVLHAHLAGLVLTPRTLRCNAPTRNAPRQYRELGRCRSENRVAVAGRDAAGTLPGDSLPLLRDGFKAGVACRESVESAAPKRP